jgi:hypothetical protein
MNKTDTQTSVGAVRCIRVIDDEGAELRMAKNCKERALRSRDMGLYRYWLQECVRLMHRAASKPRPSSIGEAHGPESASPRSNPSGGVRV